MRSAIVFSLLLFTSFLSIVDAEYWIPMYKKDTPYCMKRLLRSEGFHPGRHIRVSSEHDKYGDRRRVVKDGDPWCTSSGNRFGEWVQVDLGSMKLISGVLIEGWKWGHSKAPPDVEWNSRVTHYSVEFSPDGRLWTVIKDENGLPRHFHTIREDKSVRKNEFEARAGYQSFDPLLHARFFRLRIHAWRRHQCLSMELYGCESHWAMGNIQLMQPQRSINIDCMKRLLRSEGFHPGRHIRVSSEHDKYGDRRRVVKDGDPWCTSSGNRFGEWVQVDLGSMKLISGVLIEGWKWGHSKAPPDVEWNSRVTHYSVEFSPDGRLWTVIKDENGLPRHFHTIREDKSVRKNEFEARAGYQSFDPLLHARFFRLRIHAWRRHQCLSMELYGCESRE
ncbi:neuropilin-1-like [Orbicella faveolata]|uniref:neuropilin-1-like n=1 Tax=Orbicella faveolata TaxID=48498 RepID=UPI0009E346B7|nr:neuropilin-1-like [Orbicella faveolata]